jgi:uncharacterized membrane protein YhiD involved in acid resistance
MPAAVPLLVSGAVATGAAATIGTALAGAAISSAVATGIGAAVIGAGAALATGQDVGDALTTGVVSGLTAGVGSSIGSAVAGAGTLSDAAFVAADAFYRHHRRTQGMQTSQISLWVVNNKPTGMPQQQAPFQPAGVDYSGILGLLGRQASVPIFIFAWASTN